MTDNAYPLATHADVVTDRPERYGKQLVSHLGRRHGGEWEARKGSGWIDLATGRASVTVADGALLLRITADTDDELSRLEDVVERHLVRFGERDELSVTWQREGRAQ